MILTIEHKKILNLLNEANDFKFVTRKFSMKFQRHIAMKQSKLLMIQKVLKFRLCDYNHAPILVIGDITVTAASETQVAFKNCSPFTKSIKKLKKQQ